MDPLSLAASITALISIADIAVTRGMKYYRSAKEQPKQMSALIGEAAALSGILSALRRIVEQKGSTPDMGKSGNGDYQEGSEQRQLMHGDSQTDLKPMLSTAFPGAIGKMEPVLLRSCQQTLEQFRDLLAGMDSRQGESVMNAAKRLRWPFMESEMNDLLAKLGRHKSSFQLAISVDNVSQMQRLLEGTTDAIADIQDLKAEVRAIAQHQREERENFLRRERECANREILKFLSPANYAASHKVASNLKQEGTGRWFLDGEYFQNWLKRDKSFLWIQGIAGAGKTILASMAINEIRNSCRLGDRFAYFYCDFKDVRQQDPTNAIGSIIGQLAMQEEGIPECLRDIYGEGLGSGTRERPSLQGFMDLLVEIVKGSNGPFRTYIIIDALDECAEREGLLTGLVELHSLSNLRINILATSRKEYDIIRAFDGLPTLPIGESDIAEDVELYVVAEIKKHPRLNGMPDPVKSRIKLALVQGAHGMFRWVKCQLDVLCKARTTRAIYDALENLPAGLDETYERILAKINDDDVELAFRALTWVTCSARPLKVGELAEAIVVSPGQTEIDEDLRLTEPSDIFDICGNLLCLTSDTVGLAHYSVREFLTSDRMLGKPRSVSRFAISEESGHRELANTCLTYLSYKDFDAGPCRNAESLRARLQAYPLLVYAAGYWGLHSECGDIDLEESFLSEISKPGNNKVSNLLEVTSYQDRLNPLKGYEGRFYDDGNEGLLCTLVRFGFVSLAEKLINRGADVNAQGGRYGNVLQLAANMNNASLVRLLLERGANVNAAGGYFGNALQAASIRGDLETIKILLEWGADVNARGGGLLTALQGASINGRDGAVRLFLEYGADVNIIGGYHGSALRAAALAGYIGIAEMLLQHGAAVNTRDDTWGSALEAASGSGNYELVKMLLEHGAEVNPRLPMRIVGWHGFVRNAALARAGFHGDEKIMRLLLDHGADVSAYGNETALAAVVGCGRSDLMDMLLAEGANINGAGTYAGNPLEMAVKYGQHELAQSLLRRGADPNGCGLGAVWSTPLLEATVRRSEKDIRLLVSSGANINATGISYGSALQAAASWSDMETVRLLLDLGADVNTPGGIYGSPFLASASHGKKDIVDLLLSLGASTTMPDCYGFSTGHYLKYGWYSLITGTDDPPDWLGAIANGEDEVDLTKCKETIRTSIVAIKLCTTDMHIFEILGRGLLIYGMEGDALTSLEQQIRRIGKEGVFVHPRCCDECKTTDDISGPRYVCKICWDYDLCSLCYENVKGTHGKESGVDHGFVEVPGEGWLDLPEGAVNRSGESFEEWLGRVEEKLMG